MPKYQGMNINISAYARIYGLKPSTLRSRMKRNVPLDKLFAPPGAMTSGLYKDHAAEYRAWASIKHRCSQFGYIYKMTPRWKDFRTFLQDVGPRPSPAHELRLKDRAIRHYNPDNVHWVKAKPRHTTKAYRLPKKVTGRLDWLLKAKPPED